MEATQEQEVSQINKELQTHQKIQTNHTYELLTLDENFARVKLLTRFTEKVDDTSYVYPPAIFSCANFCAMAAINEPKNHLISSCVDFFNPIREEDEEIIFEATATTNSSGKKQVDVIGLVKDIIVFEASFVTIKLDQKSLIKE